MKAWELKLPPLLLLGVTAVLMWGLARAMPAGLPVAAAAAQGLVALFGAAGGAVLLAAVAAFRRQRTTVDPRVPARSSVLVTTGIYRVSRNPMYLGMLLLLLAWALYLQSLASVMVLPLFVALIHRLQIHPEERHMRELFGDDYRAYCSRVRRWL
jgi:protein-S-isoprenylcysteine O-methyltransferase Ste14